MLCVQWVIGHLFLFLPRKFPFLLLKISISTLEKYEFLISLSTLETQDRNFKFLVLLSKFEIRISNFSFYSRNSRSEFKISLSTLEFTFFDSRQCLSGGLLLPPRRLATASWCLPALARAAATISGPSAGAGSSSATSCLQRST